MKKYKITTPNTAFCGQRLGIEFYMGEATAECSEETVAELDSWGYVTELIVEKKAPARQTKKTEK